MEIKEDLFNRNFEGYRLAQLENFPVLTVGNVVLPSGCHDPTEASLSSFTRHHFGFEALAQLSHWNFLSDPVQMKSDAREEAPLWVCFYLDTERRIMQVKHDERDGLSVAPFCHLPTKEFLVPAYLPSFSCLALPDGQALIFYSDLDGEIGYIREEAWTAFPREKMNGRIVQSSLSGGEIFLLTLTGDAVQYVLHLIQCEWHGKSLEIGSRHLQWFSKHPISFCCTLPGGQMVLGSPSPGFLTTSDYESLYGTNSKGFPARKSTEADECGPATFEFLSEDDGQTLADLAVLQCLDLAGALEPAISLVSLSLGGYHVLPNAVGPNSSTVTLKLDVDLLICALRRPSPPEDDKSVTFNHEGTLNAMAYVLEGKHNARLIGYLPSLAPSAPQSRHLCVIAERKRFLYLYDCYTPNSKSDQTILDLGDYQILGLAVLQDKLLILTNQSLLLLLPSRMH